MNVSFSTTGRAEAERYLSMPCYDYLSKERKEYILNNLGVIRVQDPMMYAKPVIEFSGDKNNEAEVRKHYNAVLSIK